MNAEGSYVSQRNLDKLKLRRDSRFTWQIDDEADTTVGNTDCAYDRIITTGSCTQFGENPNVYRFDQILDLTNEQAKEISDHYPVTLDIN